MSTDADPPSEAKPKRINLPAAGVGAASAGAIGYGAIALGAVAVGAFAIGALVIGGVAIRKLRARAGGDDDQGSKNSR